MVVDCEHEEWSLSLPSIVGEELGNKIQIKVEMGQADKFFGYNQKQRLFTMKPQVLIKTEGEF